MEALGLPSRNVNLALGLRKQSRIHASAATLNSGRAIPSEAILLQSDSGASAAVRSARHLERGCRDHRPGAFGLPTKGSTRCTSFVIRSIIMPLQT
jgi:hypothetical protein